MTQVAAPSDWYKKRRGLLPPMPDGLLPESLTGAKWGPLAAYAADTSGLVRQSAKWWGGAREDRLGGISYGARARSPQSLSLAFDGYGHGEDKPASQV